MMMMMEMIFVVDTSVSVSEKRSLIHRGIVNLFAFPQFLARILFLGFLVSLLMMILQDRLGHQVLR